MGQRWRDPRQGLVASERRRPRVKLREQDTEGNTAGARAESHERDYGHRYERGFQERSREAWGRDGVIRDRALLLLKEEGPV